MFRTGIKWFYWTGLVLMTFSGLAEVKAATFTVTNTNDGGAGSFRQAVADANAAASSDIIEFDAGVFNRPQSITLSSGGISIANNGTLQINGTGADFLILSGNNQTGVINISSTAVVTINGVTVANGSSANGEGGGIFNFGSLTLNGCVIKNNFATFQGGGIYNNGTLVLNNSKVSNNSSNEGGGIFHQVGSVTINNSIISENTGIGVSSRSQVYVNNSTVHSNIGGGFYNFGGLLNLTNSTVCNNFRNSVGGGIVSESGIVNLVNTTVAFNASIAGNGGGIYRGGGTINARNSIIAMNTGNGAASDFAGTLTSQGYNLIGTTLFMTITGDTTGNLLNVDARLKPLASNGGDTQTCALQQNSPAIDAGDPANIQTADQRGVSRPVDGDGNGSAQPDIGAFEAGILVSNTNDSGAGSLRQAIADANASAANDEIRFSSLFETPQIITLTSGELPIAANGTLLINGPGTDKLTVSGNNQSRVFSIATNAGAAFERFKIANGAAPVNSVGGGIQIFTGGRLSLTDALLSGNSAHDGGAIFNAGILTVNNATISYNSTGTGAGGGIWNFNGILKIANSTVSNNTAGDGGAVNNTGILNVLGSTLSSNSGINGGAVYHATGTAIINNSLINNNQASAGAGGIYASGNVLNLSNSTVTGNTTPGSGGGILSVSGTTNLLNATVAFNSAHDGGGTAAGLFAPVNARNTIIARNTDVVSTPDISGSLNSQGYNLIGNTSGATITGDATGNRLNVDPLLGALADNGGPTRTLALLPNSPAIDAGEPGRASAFDQRGFNRSTDGSGDGTLQTDIGAYEFGTLVANTNSGGGGSLRQALLDARAFAGDDEIRFSTLFDSPQTIILTTGELFIGGNGRLTIDGGGNLTISGNNQTRILTVGAFADLTLSGLTLMNGRAQNSDGGAIINHSSLTIDNCKIMNNTASGGGGNARGGGAIFNNIARLKIRSSLIVNNSTTGGTGGGILNNLGTVEIVNSLIGTNTAASEAGGYDNSGGTTSITSSRIENNVAPRSAGIRNGGILSLISSSVKQNVAAQLYGGIYNNVQLNIIDSTISGNQTGGTGGGIFNLGTLSLLNSTVSGNTAATGGGINNNGGINNDRGNLSVLNSTISGNRATSFGGGLYTIGGKVDLTNATIAFNSAATNGGGIFNPGTDTTPLTVRNTIISNNTTGPSATPSEAAGALTSLGYNLIGNTNGATIGGDTTGNLLNVPARLDPVLRENGGATKTHALRGGSPAVDAGSALTGLNKDQRGFVRPIDFPSIPNASGGNGSDIGAFERQLNDIARNTTAFDFDGDARTDVSIFRPSDSSWWYLRSIDSQFRVFSFGTSSDVITPGDFTGDGRTDIAVFRPAIGEWFIQRSEDNTFFSFPFGSAGDLAAPADYDGDGRADAAVFRPSTATWFIQNSGGSGTSIVNFGAAEDKPVAADFDGDGKADIAVFRPSDGSWWYLQSSNSQFKVYRFGVSTDKPVPGDYTGDGRTDIAVFRPSTGEWFVQRSEDNSYYSFPFGTLGDVPAAGDYDGDGQTDAAVFRPSGATWYLNQTTAGVGIVSFGNADDRPVPNAFVP